MSCDSRPAKMAKTMSKQTGNGERILAGLPICVPKIMLPQKDIDLDRWACVACDQFEAEPHYWEAMYKYAGESPSTLKLMFPEVYLASVTGADPSEDDKRIEAINETMHRYVGTNVFADRPPAFVALDRKTAKVPTRKGLMIAIDLDQYNYNCQVPTLIRPTEKTIVERLPPRIKIRENAPLEMPHIIMVIDDPEKSVIEPLFTKAGLAVAEYECTLFNGAGSVTGMRVTEDGESHFQDAMTALVAKEATSAKAAGREPAALLIGDGNHSLATAKSCWEALKKQGGVDTESHPARYCLVELQNLHDDGVVFEPIHRILVGAEPDFLQSYLESAWACKGQPYVEPAPLHSVVVVKGPSPTDKVLLIPPADKLPVVSMSSQVDKFLAEHLHVKINYVHGEEPVIAECKKELTVGLLLPSLDKSRFLETVHDVGTLPRKAFSMGEANEKRFYIEARSILPVEGLVSEKAVGA